MIRVQGLVVEKETLICNSARCHHLRVGDVVVYIRNSKVCYKDKDKGENNNGSDSQGRYQHLSTNSKIMTLCEISEQCKKKT